MILPLDRAELRRLAEAATPSPWCETIIYEILRYADKHDIIGDTCARHGDDCRNYLAPHAQDAAYLAAASPATVLALLDEIERLEREVAKGLTVEVADVTNDAATLAECGRLRAEVARLEGALERYGAHHLGCWYPSERCSCGLDAARRVLGTPDA